MKTLPDQFAYQGHTLTLIQRTQTVGIWSTTREGESTPGFIVAKIKEQKPVTRIMPDGREVTMEHKEVLPGENDFGRSAWFFRDQVIAQNRFAGVTVASNAAFHGSSHTLTRAEPLEHKLDS